MQDRFVEGVVGFYQWHQTTAEIVKGLSQLEDKGARLFRVALGILNQMEVQQTLMPRLSSEDLSELIQMDSSDIRKTIRAMIQRKILIRSADESCVGIEMDTSRWVGIRVITLRSGRSTRSLPGVTLPRPWGHITPEQLVGAVAKSEATSPRSPGVTSPRGSRAREKSPSGRVHSYPSVDSFGPPTGDLQNLPRDTRSHASRRQNALPLDDGPRPEKVDPGGSEPDGHGNAAETEMVDTRDRPQNPAQWQEYIGRQRNKNAALMALVEFLNPAEARRLLGDGDKSQARRAFQRIGVLAKACGFVEDGKQVPDYHDAAKFLFIAAVLGRDSIIDSAQDLKKKLGKPHNIQARRGKFEREEPYRVPMEFGIHTPNVIED